MSMDDKIKKQIEEEALRRFQDDRSHLYRDRDNFLIREGFIDGAEYGYNIKESVNEKLVEALKEAQDELIKLKPVSKMPEDESFYLAWHKRNEILSASNKENNEGWISVEDRLPKHLNQCVFLLNNGNVCIGKVKYFEHGDSELVDFMGKGINMYKRIYRNWEIKNFDGSKEFEVTHWMPLPKAPQ